MAAIAQQIATSDPARSQELITRAVELADTITDYFGRNRALAAIAGATASSALLVRAMHWRTLSLGNVLEAMVSLLAGMNPSSHSEERRSVLTALTRTIMEFSGSRASTS